MAKAILSFQIEECKGCGICIDVCPKKLLEEDTGYINVKGVHAVKLSKPEECTACANCAIMCPDAIIKVEKE